MSYISINKLYQKKKINEKSQTLQRAMVALASPLFESISVLVYRVIASCYLLCVRVKRQVCLHFVCWQISLRMF